MKRNGYMKSNAINGYNSNIGNEYKHDYDTGTTTNSYTSVCAANIEYEPLTPQCIQFITSLIVENPRDRLGFHSSQFVLEHTYYRDINFDMLYRTDPGPIQLILEDPLDTSYFDFYDDLDQKIPNFEGNCDPNSSCDSKDQQSDRAVNYGEDDFTSFSFHNI